MAPKSKKAAPKGKAAEKPAEEAPAPAEEPAPASTEAAAPAEKAEEPAAPEEPKVAAITLEQAQQLAQYDLIPKMTPFLDRHLILPFFKFLMESGMYEADDLKQAELDILLGTNMIDETVDRYERKGLEVPEDLTQRRKSIVGLLSDRHSKVLPLLEILESEDKKRKLESMQNVSDCCQEFGLEHDIMESLMYYTKLQFDCGNYSLCMQLMKHYLKIMEKKEGEPIGKAQVNSYWGALATYLLNHQYDLAGELVGRLDKILDDKDKVKVSKREVLLQRTWLLHWTLFAIFSADKVEVKLLDFFINEKSLSVISLAAPHLLRYVAASLILHKRLKHLVKDTVWIIHHEASSYSDPITRFLLALYAEMDFDEAQLELQQCASVCKADYFLAQHWPEFEENARLLIFETYCRIHQCINIGMIASKLNMEAEEAELWIVKLIQSAKLDARIDSEKNRVVMSKAPPSVYQQVIEKTKNLSFRSTMLLSNLEKRDRERGA